MYIEYIMSMNCVLQCPHLPQHQYTVKDDEDLAHYRDQPDRMIEEFKRMKLAKNKAAQFAVEAKQTAQKVSSRHSIKGCCRSTKYLKHPLNYVLTCIRYLLSFTTLKKNWLERSMQMN